MTIRLALIGLGDIAVKAHLPALSERSDVTLVQAIDPAPDRRCVAADSLPGSARITEDFTTADAESWDAAIVATSPWVTPGILERLAEHPAIRILAEKPLAVEESVALDLLERHPTLLNQVQLGVTYRHHPHVHELRRAVAEGRLGRPLNYRCVVHDERNDPRDPEHGRRIREALAHGDPLLHEGPHIFDWLGFISGETWTASASARSRSDASLPGSNLVLAQFSGSGGSAAQVEVTWLTGCLAGSYFEVVGSRGFARLDLVTMNLEVVTPDAHTVMTAREDRTLLCFRNQLAAFLNDAREGSPPTPGLDVALSALRLTRELESVRTPILHGESRDHD